MRCVALAPSLVAALRAAAVDADPEFSAEGSNALVRLGKASDAAKEGYVAPATSPNVKVSAPFLYDGQALQLIGRDNVALVDFSDRYDRTIDATTRREGVHVRWRLLVRGAEASQSGSDDLFCDTHKGSDGIFVVGAEGSRQRVAAGPLAVDWWGRDLKTGEVIWMPEEVVVALAADADFEKLELTRFLR